MARTRRRFNYSAVIGTVPMILVAVGVFVIGIAFTFFWSFTSSKLFPAYDFVGLKQYCRLWASDRWLISVYNIWIFGLLTIGGNMVFGFLLAVFMDQNVRGEDLLASTPRQIHLQRLLGYPEPRYLHVPVVRNAAGEKLSKQTGAAPVDASRPGPAIEEALRFLGQDPPEGLSPADLLKWAILRR